MQVLSKLLEPNDKSQKVCCFFSISFRQSLTSSIAIDNQNSEKGDKIRWTQKSFGNTQPTRPYQKKV
jgi:hypothetical protein